MPVHQRLTVGIIFGGRSSEHEVSIVSAASVIKALNPDKYRIVPIGIAKSGRWYVGEQALTWLKQGQEEPESAVALPADPTMQKLVPLGSRSNEWFEKLDVLFPLIHGPLGEDGTLQGLLELTDLPYVGAGVLGSALSMDKIMQKQVCNQLGLPAVDFLWIRDIDWRSNSDSDDQPLLLDQLANMNQEQMLQVCQDRLGYPLFVKPANLGSSIGISKARNRQELRASLEEAFLYDKKVIIEQAVQNVRELEVSILGNDKPRASVIGEIVPSNEFYDYNAKYIDGTSTLIIPAELEDGLVQSIQLAAIKAFLAVGAEGMARVDFLLDNRLGRFFLSEVNTIPGFTSISMYPKLWQASGLSYSQLLDELIRLALERQTQKNRLQKSYCPKSRWYTENG
ncbi:MAG TPA: D-alanine--D-alanine ligase family protein [bacterium]|nr:D-alanine--D-alanine ligase family protein [bacterium]HOX85004.1 D-alanine--D-alanine ligase family protein [bacterium]HPG44130.1 D-alanine--D-alanine ligase family protein [bacterium]HPM96497.1 D-alanine--D-alanine ligase family protein [bacterium]